MLAKFEVLCKRVGTMSETLWPGPMGCSSAACSPLVAACGSMLASRLSIAAAFLPFFKIKKVERNLLIERKKGQNYIKECLSIK